MKYASKVTNHTNKVSVEYFMVLFCFFWINVWLIERVKLNAIFFVTVQLFIRPFQIVI